MAKQRENPADISQWQAESIRLTAFPAPSFNVQEKKWWFDLTGTEPETRNIRSGKGELTEQGPFDQGLLTLKIAPFRIDWFYTPKESEEDSEGGPWRTIGSFPDAGDKFVKLMLSWLSPTVIPPLHRIALGAVLLQPVNDMVQSYRVLTKYLPAVNIADDSADFFYQINRPRNSKLPEMANIRVNRLSKWSAISLQRKFITVGSVTAIQEGRESEKHYASRLEIDINTSADFKGDLPKEALASSFREMYEFGKEIAFRGDIP